MYILGKRADLIEDTDILRLVESKTQESKTLDYKKELTLSKDADKKEFLYDVAAMYNTDGGCIIYGIEELKDEQGQNTGLPKSVVGISIENLDKTTQLIEDIVKGNSEPRISQLIIKTIIVNSVTILLLGIPRFRGLPTMVTFNSSNKFYKRRNSGKYPVDVYELNQMFMQNQILKEKIEEFRAARTSNVISGNFLPNLEVSTSLFIYIVPLNFLDNAIIDFKKASTETLKMRPHSSGGWDSMYNIDGFGTYSLAASDRQKIGSYNQIFRNGIYEAYTSQLFYQTMSGANGFNPEDFMLETVEIIENGLFILNLLEIDPPFYISFSFHNVMNKVIDIRRSYNIQKFRNNNLILPFVLLENYTANVKSSLKFNFDILYQSVGFEKSPDI